MSIPRKACSLCPSWGPGSCVGQHWPWSSPREWAYWRSRGEVSGVSTNCPHKHKQDLDPDPVSLPPRALAHLRFTEAHADESSLSLWRSASSSFMWNFDQTALPGPSSSLPAASSSFSSSDVPSGLNASGKNTTSAESGPPPRFYIGVALTVGFTLMFVVDQIGSYFSTQGKLAGALSPASLGRNRAPLKST